jgi:NADPH:quinone reductase-like Zn-dependent oxidoreductase
MSANSCNASRTFSTPFGANGTYEQYCLADAELASKVGLVGIVSIELLLTSLQVPNNVSFDEAAPITVCFNPFATATYAQRPQGMALTPPFETGGLGKYSNQPIVIMGGACSVGQYGTIELPSISF